ncbi:winged helix-turn-helix transcriptional regulator [Microbispora sp. RL4-1S]|uniref:Winged helix-turn-helix transcriptional regulator n=1 Tax=Microbispora oryzae TaxID=2806554 RepID=A0A940WR17_9ACTN|nr:winged helix-turn-helix domain-containing protein [Microbispora oryzae]MBP2705516.1 winged helix-turn-helix transcriptional regulator [Microbispora oryzae]
MRSIGTVEPGRDRTERNGEPDIARAAALIADPSRARILKALGDGRSLPSSLLAAEAGVSAATVSGHLRKLVESGLVLVEQHGRHRYHRLAGPEVSAALEALAVIAPPSKIRTLRDSSRTNALSRSRTCYDHLAGRLGVALMQALLHRDVLTGHDGTHRAGQAFRDRPAAYGHDHSYQVTDHGRAELARFGVDLDRLPPRRPAVRYCVDWSEHRHHLAGALGAAITGRLFELGWLQPGTAPRVVHLTEAGAAGLLREFGLVDY